MSGTTFSQLILVAISPILTRLYTPEDFAVLALFGAFAQIAAVVANGRYEMAIYLPKHEGEAYNIAVLGGMVAVAVSTGILLGVLLLQSKVAEWWNMPQLESWLWFLPIAVLLSGIFSVAQSANIRLGAYKAIATANIVKALVQAALQVALGLVITGPGGLVLGRTFTNGAGNLPLIRNGLAHVGGHRPWHWSELWVMAKKYRRFPLYSVPAGLVNVGNANLLNFVIPMLLGPTTLGFYALAMRVLGAPLQQVAMPIGQVFMREASHEIRETGSAKRSFVKGMAALMAVSVLLFGSLYFVIEPIFGFVFGSEWAVAGRYAAILMPLFAARFVVSPLSGTASLTDNRHALAINIFLLVVSALVLGVAYFNNWDAETLLTWFNWSLFFVYVSYLPILYCLAVSESKNNTEHA
ncbi:oligosaccharide flippase family protein [Notoacmeibacter sp. MSK16QG-6]|uniref:oligosaccharide flippase family protein n=1 Tax=Notoacmeibacter sp. MSK16QG-6 TaxID=2957982 RepID=UPI00209FBBCA|nr:oligosaccharide flippase family protein [Notoacmeibacter sp. MSK16QG-6]MCP1198065.1 oligosaccharide flippase family protein [Notoacmeibacter sp. MSK16QG-6]